MSVDEDKIIELLDKMDPPDFEVAMKDMFRMNIELRRKLDLLTDALERSALQTDKLLNMYDVVAAELKKYKQKYG